MHDSNTIANPVPTHNSYAVVQELKKKNKTTTSISSLLHNMDMPMATMHNANMDEVHKPRGASVDITNHL